MKRKALTILFFWGLLLALSITFLATRVNLDSDLLGILTTGSNDDQVRLITWLQQGPALRLILAAIEGGTEDERAGASKTLIKQLHQSQLFSLVSNGGIAGFDRAPSRLNRYRYLLDQSLSADSFSSEALSKGFKGVLKQLKSPFALINKRQLSEDPTGSWRRYLGQLQGQAQPEKYRGVWVSDNGQRALMVIVLRQVDQGLDIQRHRIELIRQRFKQNPQNQPLQLTLTGPAVFATDAREVIKSETQTLSAVASVVIALILLIVYRSPRVMLLSSVPVITGVVVAAAAVGLLFGKIHGISLAFGITLLGIVIDYPIHVFSHMDEGASLEQTIRRIWPTLRLGMLTTVVAYIAMALTEFAGLAQLGVFAIVGIATGALTTRWILPALIAFLPEFNLKTNHHWITVHLAELPGYTTVFVLAAAAGVIAIALASDWGRFTQMNLAEMSSVPRALIDKDNELRSQLKAPSINSVIVIQADSADAALRYSERVTAWLDAWVDKGQLQSYDAPSRYLPSVATQTLRQQTLPDRSELKALINSALKDLPLRPAYFQPFVAAMEDSKALPPLHPWDVRETLIGNKIKSMLFELDQKWVALILLGGVSESNTIAAAIDNKIKNDGTSSVRYIDISQETNALLTQYRNETISRIGLGMLLMLVVLAIGLRSLQKMLRVLVPVCLAVAVNAAILLVIGEALSIFHLVALLLTFGISIDYALFLSRSESYLLEHRHSLFAVIVCAISTVAVFGILGLSAMPVLQAIGRTVAIGVAVSFLLALILSQRRSKAAT